MLTWKSLLATSVACVTLAVMPARAGTLEEALGQAYGSNPGVELSRAVARANDELVTQAEAAYGPTLDLRAAHEFTFTETHFATGVSQESGFSSRAELALSQRLFTSGGLAANRNRAQAQALGSREDLRDSSQTLILDVIAAYLAVRRDTELYNVASETYALLLEQSNLTANRLRLRDATAPDVDQTVNRLEVAAGQVLEARASLGASAAQYRALVGVYPDNLAPPPPLPETGTLEALYETAEATNPRLQSQKRLEDLTRAQLAGVRASMGPQVVAEATAGRSPLSVYENSRYALQVVGGVSVTVPLYAGGAIASREREAIQRNIAAQFGVEEARRAVRSDIAANWSALLATRQSLPRYAAAVAAAQRAVAGVQQQERSGIRTLRDVLEVTRDLFNARSNAVAAEAELYFRQASLLHGAGLLTIDLFQPGAEYDPDSYSPGAAWRAGLPLLPLLDPLDGILLRDGVDPAVTDMEGDAVYEDGERLADPLQPLAP